MADGGKDKDVFDQAAEQGGDVFDQITKTPTPAAPSTPPGFGNRFSEVTLGTQHPIDQAKSEFQQLKEHPLDTLGSAAGTAAMMPVHLAYNLVHHPIDTVTGMTGGPQFAEDLKSRNYRGMAGDVAGGLVNATLAKKGVESLPDVAEGTASAINKAPEAIARATRAPNNTLKPIVGNVGRLGGAASGYAVGGPPGALVGGYLGRSLTDSLLPRRAPVPARVPMDEFGFPASENPPAPRGRFTTLPSRMPKSSGPGNGVTGEGIPGSTARAGSRLVLTPQELSSELQMQRIARQRASENGMKYAAGMRPGGGGKVPSGPTPIETVEYPGPRSRTIAVPEEDDEE